MKELTAEMIELAKTADSPMQLQKLAQDKGLVLTEAEAAAFYEQLNPRMGELEDDELDMVSGGCGGSGQSTGSGAEPCYEYYYNARCKTCGAVTFGGYTENLSYRCPKCGGACEMIKTYYD